MAVTAPTTDKYGAQIDASIAVSQALVNRTSNSAPVYPQYALELNQLQVQAVDHYMVTGWLNAATILATYQPPAWDKAGATIVARVAFLQNLVNNAPAMPPGNAFGYGGAGWTTVAAAYQQMLYAKQIELVEHIMALPGGTSAATMLANLTGFQSFPFEYSFTGVGFDDADDDDDTF